MLIVGVTVVFYALGFSAWGVLVAAVGVSGLALGEHYRRKPNIKANRTVYIALFACWVGLAIFFLLSILLIDTGILQPSLSEEVAFEVTGWAVGGALGDWVGRRRGYDFPDWG